MASVVALSDETADDLDSLVESGRYSSREAAVAHGVRRLREYEEWLRMVDAKVARGREDVAAGRVHSIDQVREEMRAYFGSPR